MRNSQHDTATKTQPTPVDLSPEDRALLSQTALHGDAATLRQVLLKMVGKVRGGTLTAKKAEASRQNGKRGGRPPKDSPAQVKPDPQSAPVVSSAGK